MSKQQLTPDLVSISLTRGYRVLKPIEHRRVVKRLGLFKWEWRIENEYMVLSNGPFWTRRGAETDMARYPT